MVANIVTVGCMVLAGVLCVNINNGVAGATPPATGLATQASIWLNKKNTISTIMFLCSAAIIERNHVLAHSKCIEYYKADNLVVALGTAELSSTKVFYEVKKITYENGTEMALIRTEQDTFAPTSVVTLRDKTLGANSKCVVSGWLDSSTPWKEQAVTYIPDTECKEQYKPTHTIVEDGAICAHGLLEQNCGSLGMSLTCDDQLTGLFSLADFECKLPGQCTGVPHSKAWIEKQLALARGGASGMRASLFAVFLALLVAYKTLA